MPYEAALFLNQFEAALFLQREAAVWLLRGVGRKGCTVGFKLAVSKQAVWPASKRLKLQPHLPHMP